MRNGCRMQAPVDEAEHSKASLAVVSAPVLFRNRSVEFQIKKSHESESMSAQVGRVLFGVEFDEHDYIVDAIKSATLLDGRYPGRRTRVAGKQQVG